MERINFPGGRNLHERRSFVLLVLLKRSRYAIAMILLQLGYAVMNILTKKSLTDGMSHYVLVVYRHAIASAAITPFVVIFERRFWPRITFAIFIQIVLLGLLGPVVDQNLYYAGLKLTSPTFAAAMSNTLSAMTFVMAILCRMEKVDLKRMWCLAKVVGTLTMVAGAMLMTLYKGPIVQLFWTRHSHWHHPNKPVATDINGKEWLKGSIFLLLSTLAWAGLFVLQAKTLKKFERAQLTLTWLICFSGTLEAVGVTFFMEHKPNAWTIGWNMNLLTAAYAGIVTSSIAYYIQGLVIKERGPVFASAFSPLAMIIVAIMGTFILDERIFLGGVFGAILIIIGLYTVLWGKNKETREMEREGMGLPA